MMICPQTEKTFCDERHFSGPAGATDLAVGFLLDRRISPGCCRRALVAARAFRFQVPSSLGHRPRFMRGFFVGRPRKKGAVCYGCALRVRPSTGVRGDGIGRTVVNARPGAIVPPFWLRWIIHAAVDHGQLALLMWADSDRANERI
jgi:hypothetical protein